MFWWHLHAFWEQLNDIKHHLKYDLVNTIEARGRYEYTIIAPNDEDLDGELDMWGLSGWEVVSTRRASSGEGYNREYMYEIILKKKL